MSQVWMTPSPPVKAFTTTSWRLMLGKILARQQQEQDKQEKITVMLP